MALDASIRIATEDLETACNDFRTEHDGNLGEMHDHAQRELEDRNWWDTFWQWVASQVDKLNQAFEDAFAKVTEVVTWIWEEIIPWIAGPPFLAASWVKWQGVNQEAASTTGSMDLNTVEGAVSWTGPAASAYFTSVEQQEGAGTVTTEMIKGLQDFLMGHLQSLLSYITDMVGVYTRVTAEAAQAVINFVGVVSPTTWTSVLEGLSDLIGTVIEEVGTMVTSMIEYVEGSVTSMAQVSQDAIAVYALPGGNQWPPPGANITAQPPTTPGGPKYPGWVAE